MRKLTKDEIIKRLYEKYKNKYDFSDFIYISMKTKSKIKCNKCGKYFEETPLYMLYENGYCPICEMNKKSKYTEEYIISKLYEIYGTEKYDFSESVYNGIDNPFTFKCNVCGSIVTTTPYRLIKRKNGFPKCNEKTYKRKSIDDVIMGLKEAQKDDLYDYSLIVEYKNREEKLPIICHHKDEYGNEHGIFYTTYGRKTKCPKCVGGIKLSLDTYINKSKTIHIDDNGEPLYNYSLIKTIENSHSVVPIICKKHGIFYQEIGEHSRGRGCPICNESKLEKEIRKILIENNIEFTSQCNFKTLPWLKCEQYNRNGLTLDFYLPKYNTAIECQGEQHFRNRKNSTFLTEEMVNKVKERDKIKYKLCTDNNIKLYYFSNLNLEYPHKLYLNAEELINDIINL